MLDAALSYAARGWAVFPLQPHGKDPLDGSSGFKDATTDAAKIRKWWGRFPDMNVGMATGAASGGVVAVDVDENDLKGKHGMDTLTAWEGERGALPETPMSITGSGGYHILLHVDGPCPCSTNAEKDVDIRGDGGYIVLPPSVHPNGNSYEWELDPDEVPVADADENALAFIGSVRPSHFGEWSEFEVPESIPEGERDEQIFRLASSLRAKGMDAKLMETICLEVNRDRCVPPLSDAKVRAKVRSAMRYRPGRSDEFEAKAKAAADKPAKKQRPKKFDFAECGDRLMRERGMCFIDGMPAICRQGGGYEVGWPAVRRAVRALERGVTVHDQNEVRGYLADTAPEVAQSPWTLVAFANGVLDLGTMELRPMTTADVITNVIPHDWDPGAYDGDVMHALERMACGDPDTFMNLCEVVGLCMARTARFGVCPVLTGKGSNGKSTYIEMLEAVLGRDNISSLQPQEIGQRFQAGAIAGKLANLGDDIPNDYLDGAACSQIKKVATGNRIYTDVKGADGYMFRPYCTMVFSANGFPRLQDTSYGMMRRLFPVPFRASFSAEDEDFDPNIADRLTDEAACRALCALGIDGLRSVMGRNGMTPNPESRELRREIEVDNSTVEQWIEDGVLDASYVVERPTAEVYAEYRDWCAENGVNHVGSRKFCGTLRDKWHVQSVPKGHVSDGTGRRTVRIFAKE